MTQATDIWNSMIKEIASPVGPCGIGSHPIVLHLNRELKQKKSKLINTFIDEYLEKHDLAHLYALSSACFEVIESVVPLVLHDDFVESEEDFRDIVESELGCFSEIESILSPQELINELWKAAKGEYWSQGKIETPENMRKLGELSFELQKRIENSTWDLSDMTHAYMCSLTIGNYKKFDYESFIYQISRGVQCDETINSFIPYLQKEASGREVPSIERHWYEAEVLRLIQWAEIGNISEYVKDFCKTIKIHHPQPVDEDFHDTVWKYMSTPFPLFRSDLALEYLKGKLSKYLFACQVWLQNTLQKSKYSDDPVFHIAKMTISAVYLFGAYRLDASNYDKDVLEHAGSYLQTYQQPDAAFISEQQSPWIYLELNAMIVHALWISEAFGWKRTIKRAFDWIIGELDIYGVWYDRRYSRTGYLTGLLLDTIELIEGGENLTFSIPQYKRKKPKTTVQHAKVESIDNLIITGDIYNIFGNTIQSGSAKSKKKAKKKIPSSKDKLTKKKHKEWKNCYDARLIYNTDNRFIFQYQEKDTDLWLRHSGPCYELLTILMEGDCSRNNLEGYDALLRTKKGEKRPISDTIRRTNELLNKKITTKVRPKGFADIPKNIKFVGYDRVKQVYRFYIPFTNEHKEFDL